MTITLQHGLHIADLMMLVSAIVIAPHLTRWQAVGAALGIIAATIWVVYA